MYCLLHMKVLSGDSIVSIHERRDSALLQAMKSRAEGWLG